VHISEFVCPRRPSLQAPERPAVLLLCIALLLSACQTLSPTVPRTPAQQPSQNTVFRPEAEYLTYMHMLAVATPAAQKSLYQQAARNYREQATPHDKLRFALALSVLDAPYGDAAKAHQLYKELLPPAQAVPPEIESLLQVQINEAKQRLILEERLALLQQELDKAEAKIQALTTIERTLEQPIPETKTKALP
jgi:hypothetical protein